MATESTESTERLELSTNTGMVTPRITRQKPSVSNLLKILSVMGSVANHQQADI
jgi:hypothetical protein